MDNEKGGDEVGDGKTKSGGKIVAIKHNDGPPYQVKHEDGSVSKHDSHEDLMEHLKSHIPGGEDNELGKDDAQMDSDYGSEGAEEAIKSLMG